MVFPDPDNKITYGKRFNFFFDGTAAGAAFPIKADFLTKVRGPSVSFYIRNTGGNTLEYSFNGNHLDGRITAAQAERFFPNRSISKIWFRNVGGSTTVEVEGWVVA